VFTKTSLCNMALDIVGKDSVLDIDNDTNAHARLTRRWFEPVMRRCLRRSDWPWAIKRVTLSPSTNVPVNEFKNAFTLPADVVKILRLFPGPSLGFGPIPQCPYRREGQYILADETTVTIKYVSDEVIDNVGVIDPTFAEWFAMELAYAISYKLTDSVQLRQEIRVDADNFFREAAAMYSQEDTDEDLVESPWVSSRGEYNTSPQILYRNLET
jgi:hypothetical protein